MMDASALTLREAAAFANLSRSALRKWAREAGVTGRKVGRRRFYTLTEVCTICEYRQRVLDESAPPTPTADLTTREAATEMGLAESTFRQWARSSGIRGYNKGRSRFYTLADVQAIRVYRWEHKIKRHRTTLTDYDHIPTAQLRRWYIDQGLTQAAIGQCLGICSELCRQLLRYRGIRRRGNGRDRGRCECGQALDAHTRCVHCGLLLCDQFPEHGPGPVCDACQREIRSHLERWLQEMRIPKTALPVAGLTTAGAVV